jgi:hypothetical protein
LLYHQEKKKPLARNDFRVLPLIILNHESAKGENTKRNIESVLLFVVSFFALS